MNMFRPDLARMLWGLAGAVASFLAEWLAQGAPGAQ